MKFDVLFDSLTDSGPHNGVKNESGGFHRHSCDHGNSFAANSEDQLHSRRILRKYNIDTIRIHEPVEHTIDVPSMVCSKCVRFLPVHGFHQAMLPTERTSRWPYQTR